MKSKPKDYGLRPDEWRDLWEEFDRIFDSQEFQPRNVTQKRWIQNLVALAINKKLKRAEVILSQLEVEPPQPSEASDGQ